MQDASSREDTVRGRVGASATVRHPPLTLTTASATGPVLASRPAAISGVMLPTSADVVLCGGGIAGLTLAYQLRRENPEASVVLIERTRRPLREGAHKVGESSVELASHYYGEILGLKEELETRHLKKNGLRFFVGDAAGALSDRTEIGPVEFPLVPSYQIDRGRFESDMRQRCEDAGVMLFEGVSVRGVEIRSGETPHLIRTDAGEIEARWVVDASGRRRILQKQLDLRRPSPNRQSGAWFRVAERVKVSELVPAEEAQWHRRDVDDVRWLSTVHLVGRGYWVWIIPLRNGFTSIGLVADAAHHPFDGFHKPERLMAWLEAHEPRLHSRIAHLVREDFQVRRDYSYLTERMMSADRWLCVGEAAAFVDPLYSLGGDFLVMSNAYTARAIADDLAGRHDPAVIEELNALWLQLSQDASRTLSHNGAMFPHADILGAKLWWDFFNYWAFMTAHFVQEIWRQDAACLARFRSLQERFYLLNHRAQSILEAWAAAEPATHRNTKSWIGLPSFPSVLLDQHRAILNPLDADATFAKMEADYETGRHLVTEVLVHALRSVGSAGVDEFARVSGIDVGWDLHFDDPRFGADALDRRSRLEGIGSVARDMERAIGRQVPDTPLLWLLDRALGRPARQPAVGHNAQV